jgi:hypothetical protein
MLFILYNYLYVYEGANFEATSYTKSINDLLSSKEISFEKINLTGNDLILGNNKDNRGDCGACRALVKDTEDWLSINFANDYKKGVYVYSDMKIQYDKKFCIGNTCIT